MLAAHERASAIRNFKLITGMRDEENEVLVDNTTARVPRDENDVNKVIQVIKGWCNPFKDVSLGAKNVDQRDFINKRIATSEVGFYEALPKKKLKTFESASMKRSVMVAEKEETFKADRSNASTECITEKWAKFHQN